MKQAKKRGRKKSRAAKKQLQEKKREVDEQLEDITCDDTDTRNTTIKITMINAKRQYQELRLLHTQQQKSVDNVVDNVNDIA